MEFPVIGGQRYRVEQVGQAIITELWGDYIISAQGVTVAPDTPIGIEFTITDYLGNPTLDEVSFFVNGDQLTTVNQTASYTFTGAPYGSHTITAYGDNIKGTTVSVTVNAPVPQPPTIEELNAKINQLIAIVGDMQLGV